MPRRNRRHETYQPLDVTPEQIPKSKPGTFQPNVNWRHTRDANERDRYERQAAARVNRSIDWSVCVVPGCGESLVAYGTFEHSKGRRDSTLELPICYKHMAIVWNQLLAFHTKREKFIDAIADVNERLAARRRREHEENKQAHLARTDGTLYFIRLGDLVKVGWTRDLWSRLKSYGASAELLVSYPGTRDDETNLHRQLRPALAKGREWYTDGSVIQHFIDEALAKFGQPPTFQFMWTQPKDVIKQHRRR